MARARLLILLYTRVKAFEIVRFYGPSPVACLSYFKQLFQEDRFGHSRYFSQLVSTE